MDKHALEKNFEVGLDLAIQIRHVKKAISDLRL
jgi:hypothetical protein